MLDNEIRILDRDTDIIERDGKYFLRQYEHESPFNTRDSKEITPSQSQLISMYRNNKITWNDWE